MISGRAQTFTTEDYISMVNAFSFQGSTYAPALNQTYGNQTLKEQVRPDFASYGSQLYASNGIVFALMAVRQLAFSQIRMQWQTLSKGRPGDMFSTPALAQFEVPWAGGSTQDLLAKMLVDADLAGNSYWTISGGEMVRLRPDWVDIILAPRRVPTFSESGDTIAATLGMKKVGYLYYEGGRGNSDPVALLPDEVCHFAPLQDPLATYRGMSWLTPLLREISSDRGMVEHQRKFFENGATPNLVVKHDPGVSPADAKQFKLALDAEYGGVQNAYKTMHLGGGADVTVVGQNFQQMDFKIVQGHGETRISAAAGVPPIIPGFSEGLSSATYSNYGQALRRFSGLTLHPLWKSAVGSLQTLVNPPNPGVRLWYDTRDTEFLREDAQDLAEVQQVQASTISSYISAGFTPVSAMAAVVNDDINLLEHTGLVSVQLWTPGADPTGDSIKGSGKDDNAGTTGSGKSKAKGNGGGKQPDATPPQEQ
jgi:hypothetical protein